MRLLSTLRDDGVARIALQRVLHDHAWSIAARPTAPLARTSQVMMR